MRHLIASDTAADGVVPVTVTFLEMSKRPALPPVEPPPAAMKLALLRAESCPLGYYRYLYDAVGAPWHWYERKRLSDAALNAILRDDRVEIYVPHIGGVPAGFTELDFRGFPDVNLAYFGLMPDFIGRHLGSWLLHWTVETAWQRRPKRLTVNTCTLDHPAALPLYQRMGFRIRDRLTIAVDLTLARNAKPES